MLPARALPAALLLALGSACAAGRGFVCPARGGPPWVEVTSAHFVVRTDVSEPRAKEIAQELEILRTTLLQALFDHEVDTPGRLEVVVFRSQDELMPYSRDLRVGGLMVEDPFGERRILLAADAGVQSQRLVAHELVHVLSHHVIHRQPRWFGEGLASFLEGAGVKGFLGARAVGSPPGPDVEFIELAVKPPARDALEWQQGRWPLEHLYWKSFLIVHYLFNERSAGFVELKARLAAGENPRAAWNAAFPEWSLDRGDAVEKLDAVLAKYAGVHLRRTPLPAAPAAPEVSLRRLSGPEVHALRLDLPHRWTPQVRSAEEQEALAEDAGHVRALEARARERKDLAVALARQAVAAHPEDARAWEFLGNVLEGQGAAEEREGAFRKAAAATPERVRPLVLLAAELGAQGRPADALAASTRAVELAPWSPVALLVHGEVLARLGRCDDALVVAWRAADVASHADAGARSQVAADVGLVERLCRGNPAPGAGTRR